MLTPLTLERSVGSRSIVHGHSFLNKVGFDKIPHRLLQALIALKTSTYHHGDLKDSLLVAAREMITEHGLAGFSLRKVGQAVGVSQAALYRHFAGKTDLLAAVACGCFLEVAELLQQAFEAAPNDGREKLKAVGLAYVIFADQHPNLYRLMFDGSLADKQAYPELTEARRRALKWAAQSVNDIHRQQPRNHADTERLDNTKFLLQSSIHGVASMVIEGLAPDYQSWDVMINALVDQTFIGSR